MPVLQPSEYDMAYFDGDKGTYKHNAGYSEYKREVQGAGEWWRNLAEKYNLRYNLTGKKILDIGCAKGYIVQDLRALGADAWGLDVSQYAIDSVTQEYNEAVVKYQADLAKYNQLVAGFPLQTHVAPTEPVDYSPYFYIGDARTYLTNFKRNEFDVVFSSRFLACIDEAELSNLISEMNKIGRQQVHIIDMDANPDFYLIRPLSWWLDLPFKRGTIIVAHENGVEMVK